LGQKNIRPKTFNKEFKMRSKIIVLLAMLGTHVAQAESPSNILEREVICKNETKTIVISQDLSHADVYQNGKYTRHKVTYLYNSGGRGQILAIAIKGLDKLHEQTIIRDIFSLGKGTVVGQRDRASGYSVELIETFECRYSSVLFNKDEF
jgi:hypothetical protein